GGIEGGIEGGIQGGKQGGKQGGTQGGIQGGIEGDEVYCCLEGCGKGGLAVGGFAEYVCAKETSCAPKSALLSFEEAAALPMASVTALQALRDVAKLKQGQSVLINGASGGVGMFAVQIAKAFGAEATAVCSTESVDIVREIGAGYIVDYTKESVAECGKQFDVVVDVAATLSVKNYRSLLKPNGICVVIGFSTIGHMISYSHAGIRDGKKIKLCAANNRNSADLLEINKLVEAGQLKVIIDSLYSLGETAEAIRRAETGRPKGKIVIKV
ncbi:MAG: NAD(P)-dependent alcohol dehydrogenase, partial [Oscillospiraceae bacterium]|nr:NAD(P)-dependent alcohol dehydrogenase [Oscillospiraceae bacterium]